MEKLGTEKGHVLQEKFHLSGSTGHNRRTVLKIKSDCVAKEPFRFRDSDY